MWDAETKQELLELPRSGNWNFNALWSPTNPGVFTTASFDGKVGGCAWMPSWHVECKYALGV